MPYNTGSADDASDDEEFGLIKATKRMGKAKSLDEVEAEPAPPQVPSSTANEERFLDLSIASTEQWGRTTAATNCIWTT